MRVQREKKHQFFCCVNKCPWPRACPESGLPHKHPYSSNARGLGGYTEGPQILNFGEESSVLFKKLILILIF
jgi:hypothetical protein